MSRKLEGRGEFGARGSGLRALGAKIGPRGSGLGLRGLELGAQGLARASGLEAGAPKEAEKKGERWEMRRSGEGREKQEKKKLLFWMAGFWMQQVPDSQL